MLREKPDVMSHINNHKHIGEIGEKIAIGELAKCGISNILIPMSENLPFDFVVFHNDKFYKCQVKTSTQETNGSHVFSLTSNNWYSKTIYKYKLEDYDILICCDLETIYIFKHEDVLGKSTIAIRTGGNPKNNQKKKINMADDCVISESRIMEVFD